MSNKFNKIMIKRINLRILPVQNFENKLLTIKLIIQYWTFK